METSYIVRVLLNVYPTTKFIYFLVVSNWWGKYSALKIPCRLFWHNTTMVIILWKRHSNDAFISDISKSVMLNRFTLLDFEAQIF